MCVWKCYKPIYFQLLIFKICKSFSTALTLLLSGSEKNIKYYDGYTLNDIKMIKKNK